MDAIQREPLTQSLQCAGLLVADVGQAQKTVGTTDPALAMVPRDLVHDAGVIKQRLAELEAGYRKWAITRTILWQYAIIYLITHDPQQLRSLPRVQ